MSNLIVSKKRAKSFALALALVLVGLFLYLQDDWWPGIMLVVGLPLALKQFLLGRRYDAGVTLFVALGVFLTVEFDVSLHILLPVIFTLGGIFIFFKEFLDNQASTVEEEEEDLNEEIEEEQFKKKRK